MANPQLTQYLDLEEENDELLFLQESLEQVNQLSLKAMDILGTFDERLLRLESLVEPIQQSSQSLNHLRQNVDDTVTAVENMLKYFDCAKDEEPIIKQGPNQDDLLPYLKSINNLQMANDFVKYVNMRSVERVSKQIKGLLELGLQNLNDLFRQWLLQYSDPIDPIQYDNALSIPKPPQATIRLLEMLVTYLATSESETGTRIDYSKVYVDIRSTYIFKSLASLRTAAEHMREPMATSAVYQKGTAPFIQLTHCLLKLAQAERNFAESILPGEQVANTFSRTLKPSIDKYFESTETLAQVAKRSIQTEKFMLFDVFETLKHFQTDMDKTLTLDASEKKHIANLTASISTPIMTSFAQYIDEAKGMARLNMPQDGTIFEFTSNAINHMKRLLEHQETVESMMVTLGDGHWGAVSDSALAAKGRKTFSGQAIVKHYFEDILQLLTNSLESKTKNSRKSGLSVVFLMNNYHYIARNIMGSRLLDVLGENDLRIYESLDWKYQDQFCNLWSSCIEYLTDDTGGPGGLKNKIVGSDKMTVKDKFKYFNTTLEELVRNQQTYTIPDKELRLNVMDRIRGALIPAYSQFMERYQHTDFAKNSGKYLRYNQVTLDRTLQSLFGAQSA
ncbi:exocyst complex component exo70 [Dimargaris xerosporica]|nr:exocyst complex component exo70 [Dimargaris xerosporica]